MITIITDKINTLNQKNYNEFIDEINFHQLSCSCSLSGHMTKHAYYQRSIKTTDGKLAISILRVRCKHCGVTHAIFPHLIVPYSQILLREHISIITAYKNKSSTNLIMHDILCIDESNIRYIIRMYLRHWKEAIITFGIALTDDIETISKKCLKALKRQFMQIKCTPNILFINNHTS